MGTIKQGILGEFNGKVGTVVGSSWKGTAYMRGRAQHIKNPRTAGQVYQREALKILALALKPISSTLNLTFKKSANKMSGYNKAVSVNYKAAIYEAGGEPHFNYERLILSQGTLKPFQYLVIEDMDENGHYYISTISDGNQYPEYDGLIFAIYDIIGGVWQTGIIRQHFHVGETLVFQGMPLLKSKDYLAYACAYDPASGKVSDPIAEVEAYAG